MKTIPISEVLTEFGSKTKPQELVKDFANRTNTPASSREEQRVSLPSAQPIDAIQSVTEESYERGLEEGRAAGLAELEAKLEEQQRFYEQRQELERCTWASREAEVLTQKLQEGLREIENAVSNTVARVFEPFLIECMREQAITMLAETLEALLTKGEGTNLEICGPEDLLQLLREKLVIQGGRCSEVLLSSSRLPHRLLDSFKQLSMQLEWSPFRKSPLAC